MGPKISITYINLNGIMAFSSVVRLIFSYTLITVITELSLTSLLCYVLMCCTNCTGKLEKCQQLKFVYITMEMNDRKIFHFFSL